MSGLINSRLAKQNKKSKKLFLLIKKEKAMNRFLQLCHPGKFDFNCILTESELTRSSLLNNAAVVLF